jgi:flavin-binding protein dodecin
MRKNLVRLRNDDCFKLPCFDRACPSGIIDGPARLDLSFGRTREDLIACVLILTTKGSIMAKQQSESVYRIIDVVGVSEKSWEDAGRVAVETAAGSLRDLRIAEVTKMDMKVDNGKVTAFRTRVALSFKYET